MFTAIKMGGICFARSTCIFGIAAIITALASIKTLGPDDQYIIHYLSRRSAVDPGPLRRRFGVGPGPIGARLGVALGSTPGSVRYQVGLDQGSGTRALPGPGDVATTTGRSAARRAPPKKHESCDAESHPRRASTRPEPQPRGRWTRPRARGRHKNGGSGPKWRQDAAVAKKPTGIPSSVFFSPRHRVDAAIAYARAQRAHP